MTEMDELYSKLGQNRSIPSASVIPVLAYPDVRQAVEWLCQVFGFTERLQIAEHRSQLTFWDGAVIVAEYIDRDRPPTANDADYFSHQVMVRISDVNLHYQHVVAHGAQILEAPVDHIFGERQYTVRDIGGHRWTFSQTITDMDPAEWGGSSVKLLNP